MPLIDPAIWSHCVRHSLEHYDQSLLRQVANNLCKPRNQWPAAELIERCLTAASNPAVIDRRLGDLDPALVQILALIGRSRQPSWRVGNLVELALALGHEDGLATVVSLLEAGLLYPDLEKTHGRAAESAAKRQERVDGVPRQRRIKGFDQWLANSTSPPASVFASLEITVRAMRMALDLPPCPGSVNIAKPIVQEADGLDLPLRLAALWQQVHGSPLRQTLSTGFFKRDLERLRGDGVLNSPSVNGIDETPDAALLAVELAIREGILLDSGAGELQAGAFPPHWDGGLSATVASLWTALLQQDAWNPRVGWQPLAPAGNPNPSMWLLALLLLSRLRDEGWTTCESIEQWMNKHHPACRNNKFAGALTGFLLGPAYSLRLLQSTTDGIGKTLIRLSQMGRWLLDLAPIPRQETIGQTILVQPNLEILAYRHGLTPALIVRLSKLADWKTLGAACTLQLEPTSVYRALETGETFETIQGALQRHAMKPTPDAVVSALKTWASKRDRIRVYTAGAILEFNTSQDLAQALQRGVPAVCLADRLAVVPNDREIDYRHFRLTSTRDYGLPPERCVEVGSDGVTLSIDLAKSDLLVEPEVRRFARHLDRQPSNGQRLYHMTPESLGRGRATGLSLAMLEAWFQQRCGQPAPPAAKLLFVGPLGSTYQLRRPVVLQVPSVEAADGLLQWPQTRDFIQMRLGPTAVAVHEDKVAALTEQLQALGVVVQ